MARRLKRRIPLAEWAVGIISAIIVLGTVGYLAFEAFQPDADEPALTATVLEIRERNGSFVVEVEVRNASRGAAAEVHIAGVARAGDGRERQGQALVDFVPGFSTRRASLVFDVNPGTDADVRIVGYTRP